MIDILIFICLGPIILLAAALLLFPIIYLIACGWYILIVLTCACLPGSLGDWGRNQIDKRIEPW